MDVKPGYKLTEVGIIPDEWHSIAIANLVESTSPVCYGVVQIGQYVETGVPIVAIKYVKEIAHAPLHRTAISIEQPYARSRVRGGDILISIKGTIGRVGIVPQGFEGNIGRELARLRISSEICSAYVAHQLEAGTTQERIMRSVVGTTRLEFSIAVLRQFELPIPPTESEQRAIATALSDMDALLDGLDRLIAKKRAIKQAAMQQLLTGRTRLPGFDGEWEVKLLGDVANIKTGSRNNKDKVEDGDYAFFVRSENIERINSYSHDCEAILVPGEGRIGEIFHYINGKFDVHQRVYAITQFAPDVSARFVHLYLTANFGVWAMQNTVKATVDSLRLSTFQNFQMRIPPTVEEQIGIAEVLGDMDAEITALEIRCIKTHALKQAMMQELLTGRTRLLEPGAKPVEETVAQTRRRKANVHFLRSVLAAEIIDQLHDQPTFGHVKFEKMIFLVEHLCDVDTGSIYHRKAAGPYDNRALRSIDGQLRKQQWFDAQKKGERYQYVPMAKRGGHRQYFDRYFSGIGDAFRSVLAAFKTAKTEQCEIVATLLAAWGDLLREQGTVSDEAIVHEVLHNWHESKQRISEDRWLKALGWMRGKGFVPKGAA